MGLLCDLVGRTAGCSLQVGWLDRSFVGREMFLLGDLHYFLNIHLCFFLTSSD
jgi:hypothetical protein